VSPFRPFGLRTALLLAGLIAGSFTPALGFQNPQDLPAANSELAARSPLLAVTRAGQRIVAVGQRGNVVFSDDGGTTWKQASVPVSSDLVAVSFPSPTHGWAVGQGGVVIHSSDGGTTWTRQLEGKQAAQIALGHYEAQQGSNAAAAQLVEREKRLQEGGGTQPFLDVLFESETTGFVVGAFNRIFRTEDGGKTWTPWMERTENPNELHFYAIRRGGNDIYMTGEQGMVWRLDAATQRFVALPTPYKGTLFGLVVDEGAGSLLVFGMRGSLLRSADGGRSWTQITTASPAGITAGETLPDGRIVLANQAGGLELSRDHGKTFVPLKPAAPMAYFGIAALAKDRVGLVGAQGARLEAVQ
jgi:photosystem II stability/assembly factor-like uncharacterized protein